ncbi:MAG: phage integrase SAM-like domain-containing protein [Bacteroidales bacterium]|nr:phage integrase SAM-like domain-containing protein [Bacteroidales bacterium]MBQ5864936.1 phage integrase SAM-like domain-containing protein [Bacteroidales bacterium]
MITYKAIVIPNNRRGDGTYPVKIRVTYKRVSRRLPTTLVCSPKDLTRSLKIKNEDIISKANELILKMRNALKDVSPFDLEDKDVDWVVRKIKDTLSGDNFKLDFFEWSNRFLRQKRESTRKAYERALNALERFLGKRELDINEITKIMLLDFMEYVDAEPKMHFNRKTKEFEKTDKEKVAKASSSIHLMKLQHIFNAAKDRFNDEDADNIRIPKSPFDTIKKVFPSGDNAQEGLPREVIQKIISAKTDNPQIRVALDAFIVSFATMGANLADMYFAPPVQGNKWIYKRIKTTKRRSDGAEMKVTIFPELLPYLNRLQDGGDGEWWLSELHRIGAKKHTCNEKINDNLRKWQSAEEVEDFTFYAARHSWATLARSMGYDLALVNDCICHKDKWDDGRRYAPSSWDERNAVNRAVIDSFVWE